MENINPIVDKICILCKMPGKGGWTYVSVSEVAPDKHSWFGLVKVSGSIDGFEITKANLMPMGDGSLFLPVKSQIRKIIKKEEGDTVHVILYSEDLPPVVEDDFIVCLKDEPLAYHNYMQLNANEQKKISDWIYTVKNDQVRVERIAQAIEYLLHEKNIVKDNNV